MGWRFRKSIKIIPGVKANITHRGAGLSAGIPGSGLSVSTRGGGGWGRGASGSLSLSGCLYSLIALVFGVPLVLFGCWVVFMVVGSFVFTPGKTSPTAPVAVVAPQSVAPAEPAKQIPTAAPTPVDDTEAQNRAEAQREKNAVGMLRAGKSLLGDKRTNWLKSVVAKYPMTQAGKDAQAELDGTPKPPE